MVAVREERSAEPNAQYATRPDYCQIFQADMHPLYLLAFLLTTNHSRAEQCYAESMENVITGNPVSREYARFWIKHNVILSAIRMVFSESTQLQDRDTWHEAPLRCVTDTVTRLAPLVRFVFVMSVLERYSEHECSRLLNCTVGDVIDARSHALRTTFTLSGVAIAQDKLCTGREQSQ
jgi:DNA-directed RNA polymerase specialized sigma24 family protein